MTLVYIILEERFLEIRNKKGKKELIRASIHYVFILKYYIDYALQMGLFFKQFKFEGLKRGLISKSLLKQSVPGGTSKNGLATDKLCEVLTIKKEV